MEEGETLQIPEIKLNVERNYTELIESNVLNRSLAGMPIAQAVQAIGFVLNKSGAKIRSESLTEVGNGHPPAHVPRQFIFDRPFLLCLREKNASQPYVAIWLENTELMVPLRP